MKKSLKVILISSLALFLIGAICCVSALTKVGFNIHKLSTDEPTQKQVQEFEIEKGDNINVSNLFGEIKIYPSSDDKLHVQYYSSTNSEYTMQKNSNTVMITENEITKPWYRYIQLSFGDNCSDMILEVPSDMVDSITADCKGDSVTVNGISISGQLKIDSFSSADITSVKSASLTVQADNSDITCSDITTSSEINLKTSYNEISVGNITCGSSMHCSTDSSSIRQIGLIKADSVDFSSESGSVNLEKIDAINTAVKTESGSIKGTSVGSEKDYAVSAVASSFKNQLGTGTANASKTISLKSESGSVDWNFEK